MNIIKNYELSAGPIKDVFNLDSFNLDTMGISLTTLIELVEDADSDKEEVNTTHVEATVSELLFKSAGGSESTPASEVMAFSYLLYTTNFFEFKAMVNSIIMGWHILRIFNRAIAKDIDIHIGYSEIMQEMVNDNALYMSIVSLTGIKFLLQNDSDTLNIDDLISKLYKGEDDTLNGLLKDLNITKN